MARKGSLFTAFLIFFIDNFGYALVFPLFAPLLLKPSYGMLSADVSTADKNILLGVLLAAYPFAQFFGAPYFGNIADKFGRRRGFFFTMGGIFLGYILSALAVLFGSYGFLLFCRFFTGFFAGNWSISFAVIADLNPDAEGRAKNFAWIAAIGGVSWVLSMVVGGDLSDPALLHGFSPALAFWIATAISGIGLLSVIFFFKETAYGKVDAHSLQLFKSVHDLAQAAKIKSLRFNFAALLFYITGWMMGIAWLNTVILERFHQSQVVSTSILIIVGIVWGISSSILSPYLISKASLKNIVFIALFLVSIFLFGASLTHSFWLFLLLLSFNQHCCASVLEQYFEFDFFRGPSGHSRNDNGNRTIRHVIRTNFSSAFGRSHLCIFHWSSIFCGKPYRFHRFSVFVFFNKKTRSFLMPYVLNGFSLSSNNFAISAVQPVW